jgi:hypothetical protein
MMMSYNVSDSSFAAYLIEPLTFNQVYNTQLTEEQRIVNSLLKETVFFYDLQLQRFTKIIRVPNSS